MKSKIRKIAARVYYTITVEYYDMTIGRIVSSIQLYFYWKKLPSKIKLIRGKDTIKVLFVNSTLNTWKTEMLYNYMSKNPRFQPIVGISNCKKYPYAKGDFLKYVREKDYNYVDLDTLNRGIKDIDPDIVFYGSPYPTSYSKGHYFDSNLEYVFCGCDYCINITKHVAHLKHLWYDFCWQFYVEHEDVAIRKREILGEKANNILVTGVPNQDELQMPKEAFVDPWKDRTGKKRIIYAPHHSFKGVNGDGIEFATFLDYGEIVLELAKKYQDKVTFAFKPHPFLYIRLLDIWGKEKTDAYYQQWKDLPNTQFENEGYFGLFKYSDAIIHDCASFLVEYLYMDNPSLFLVAESNNIDDMFDFVKDCYYSHEQAYCANDIELFIKNVINGVDIKQEQRRECINKQLIPPHGKTACENIIDAILYE